MVGSSTLFAQSSTVPVKPTKTITAPQTKTQQSKAEVDKTTLDTEESIKFIGNQLLFQVKKRLNLTTEEEEKNKTNQQKIKSLAFLVLRWRKGS